MGRHAFHFDRLIFIPSLLLVLLGLVTLLSIDESIFRQQLLFAGVGMGLFFIFSRIEFVLYHFLDRLIYVGSSLFLLLSYVGPEVRGATRWLEIGGFRLQPSELVKPFMLLAWASLLTRYPPTRPRTMILHGLLFVLPFLLVYEQPDLGTAVVYGASWLGMIFLAGIPIILIMAGLLLTTILLPLLYSLLREYQKLRLLIFVNPFIDPQGAGYNAIQSMIAVGSGLLVGRGFGRGTQSLLQFLPERHTDFIFASLTEEFGLIGGGVLIAVFFVLLLRILRRAQTKYFQTMAYLHSVGICLQLFTHSMINIGMNMGFMPITGITLPFVSYGGSSMLSTWIGLGILMSALQKPN